MMPSAYLRVNNDWKDSRSSEGTPVLDVLRDEFSLKSTKEGCREGDCGACAVLIGERTREVVRYRAVPSCLLARGELRNKHLVSLEGLVEGANGGLTPVMRAFLEENASQCGFCTPGFIIALTAWLAEPQQPTLAGALRAIDGNLCRCTGYASIRRAAARLVQEFKDLPQEPKSRIIALVEAQVLPQSVMRFLAESKSFEANPSKPAFSQDKLIVGGGTDFYVQNPEPEEGFAPLLTRSIPQFTKIHEISKENRKWLLVGAAVTVRDFFESPEVKTEVPDIEQFETMFASTLIRNLATIGGNIVNASPVADITSMLLSLHSHLVILPRESLERSARATRIEGSNGVPEFEHAREIALEDFFVGYKKRDLKPGEILAAVLIPVGNNVPHRRFSFEKASKRKNLDIAAVNSALSFRIVDGRFADVGLSFGGVASVPTLCLPAMKALQEQPCDPLDATSLAAIARSVAKIAQESVTPLSDVRGSAEYRSRMVYQLTLAHFLRLFEHSGIAEELFP